MAQPIKPVNLFSPKIWIKQYSLLPVVGFVGAGCLLAGSYMAFMCTTKPDVSFRPSRGIEDAPHKFVKPDQRLRLMEYSKPIAVPPAEIIELRREIGSYKG